jgi:hypothetical protein
MDLIGKSISPFLVNRSSSYRVELAGDNEIISHLKFIGLIKKYNKINITTLTLQPIGPITKIKRTFLCYENNRRTALLFIDRTIARAFDLVKKYNSSEKCNEKYLAKTIIEDIVKSIEGINNMKFTYESDIKFICDLESLIQTTRSKLIEFQTD